MSPGPYFVTIMESAELATKCAMSWMEPDLPSGKCRASRHPEFDDSNIQKAIAEN